MCVSNVCVHVCVFMHVLHVCVKCVYLCMCVHVCLCVYSCTGFMRVCIYAYTFNVLCFHVCKCEHTCAKDTWIGEQPLVLVLSLRVCDWNLLDCTAYDRLWLHTPGHPPVSTSCLEVGDEIAAVVILCLAPTQILGVSSVLTLMGQALLFTEPSPQSKRAIHLVALAHVAFLSFQGWCSFPPLGGGCPWAISLREWQTLRYTWVKRVCILMSGRCESVSLPYFPATQGTWVSSSTFETPGHYL